MEIEKASENKSVIVVNDLVKHFNDVQAVNGLNFEVQEGEMFGFLG